MCGCCGVNCQVERPAGVAHVARAADVGIRQGHSALRQVACGGEGSRGGVVGCRYFDAIGIELHAGHPGWQSAHVQPRSQVVSSGCVAGGALHGTHVVRVGCGRCGHRYGAGIDSQCQCAALRAFVTRCVRDGVGQAVVARGQGRVGRKCAGGRVVGRGYFTAVDIQLGRVSKVGPHVDAGGGVVGGCGRAVGALDGALVVGVAGGSRWGGGSACVHGHGKCSALASHVASRIGVGIGYLACTFGQGGSRRDDAGGCIVGGCNRNPVREKYHARHAGGQRAHIEAWARVIGRCCCAVGALHGAHIVAVASNGWT